MPIYLLILGATGIAWWSGEKTRNDIYQNITVSPDVDETPSYATAYTKTLDTLQLIVIAGAAYYVYKKVA